MDFVTELLNQYGYPILFLLGLVEFLGVPVATSPVLLLVGASAAGGMINPVGAIAAVTFGALISESIWFTAARWRGDRLVNVACGDPRTLRTWVNTHSELAPISAPRGHRPP